MWWGRIATAVLLVAFSAWIAWLYSQPFDAGRGAVAIGVLLITIGVGALLSRSPLRPQLRRWGFERSSTTRERRRSYALTMVAVGSLWLMRPVLGSQPAFLPAFGWMLATLAPLALVYFTVQRRVPAA